MIIIPEDHIKSMVLDTIFAATETSASALLNAFGLLIKYNDVAKKIQAEIDSVIGTGRLLRISDKNSMPYLMATIWEILRYTSHVPVLVPHRVLKNYNYRGYFMPKHALVIANIWYIHHDPKVWHDPWEFIPERFLDSEGNLLPPDHKLMQNVLSFSTGGRKCLEKLLVYQNFSSSLDVFCNRSTSFLLRLASILTQTLETTKRKSVLSLLKTSCAEPCHESDFSEKYS